MVGADRRSLARRYTLRALRPDKLATTPSTPASEIGNEKARVITVPDLPSDSTLDFFSPYFSTPYCWGTADSEVR